MKFKNKVAVINPNQEGTDKKGLAFIAHYGGKFHTLLNEKSAPMDETKYDREIHGSMRLAKRHLKRKGFTKVIPIENLKKQFLKRNNEEEE